MKGGMEAYRTAEALHNCSLRLADWASTPMACIDDSRSRSGGGGYGDGPRWRTVHGLGGGRKAEQQAGGAYSTGARHVLARMVGSKTPQPEQ